MKKFTVLMLSLFIGVFCFAQEITLTDRAGNLLENDGSYTTNQEVGVYASHYFDAKNVTDEDLVLTLLVDVDRENSTILEEDVELAVCWGVCNMPWEFGNLTTQLNAGNTEELKFDFNNPKKEGVTILDCKYVNYETEAVIYEFTIFLNVTNEAIIITDRAGNLLENNGSYTTNQEVGVSTSHYFDTKNITNGDLTLTLLVDVDRENSTILEEDASLGICWGVCNMPWEFGNLTTQLNAGNTEELKFDFNNPRKEGVTILNCRYVNYETEDVVYEFTIRLTVGAQNIETPAVTHLKAYPNPASTDFYVDYKLGANVSNAQIALMNILGVVVKEEQIANLSGTTRIDVSSLPAGIYFYSVKADGKIVQTKKMIISK